MRTKFIAKSIVVGCLTLLAAPAGNGQQTPKKAPLAPAVDRERIESFKGMKPPSGPSFYISPVEGSKGSFSLLLANGEGNTVAGSFTLQQLEIFEAVLEAARAFALTDEKVGSGTPITTRLMDQHEWSLFVDVSKIGNQSRFYVSLITLQGRLTAPAGEITRGSKKEPSALLLDILTKVREARTSGNLQ